MTVHDPLLTSLSDWSRMPLAAWPRSAALKVRQVGRGRIWILLDRLQVFLDHLPHRPRRPAEQRANLQVLMGIHFDVVDFLVPGLTLPGQRTKQKVRIEPSVASPSSPLKGPALPLSGVPWLPISRVVSPCGPLSEAKTTSVLSSMPSSFSVSRIWPTW